MVKWVVATKETINSKLEVIFKLTEFSDRWEMVVMFAAINLKRFWCEYACSPNQADFMKV
jgi:hypothetical protein